MSGAGTPAEPADGPLARIARAEATCELLAGRNGPDDTIAADLRLARLALAAPATTGGAVETLNAAIRESGHKLLTDTLLPAVYGDATGGAVERAPSDDAIRALAERCRTEYMGQLDLDSGSNLLDAASALGMWLDERAALTADLARARGDLQLLAESNSRLCEERDRARLALSRMEMGWVAACGCSSCASEAALLRAGGGLDGPKDGAA